MIKKIALVALSVTAGLSGYPGPHSAWACNKTAGCAMDSFRDDYDMKRDGRMDEANKAGRENIEAFRALQAEQQKAPAQQKGSARK